MGTFSWFRRLAARVLRLPSADDRFLDGVIREALLTDAFASAPVSAWDRLRSSIVERRMVRGYGMWILDEPQREPPAETPSALSGRDLDRAQRVYENIRVGVPDYRHALWNNVNPNFLMLVHL